MGTSSQTSGAGGSNPLIPAWIDTTETSGNIGISVEIPSENSDSSKVIVNAASRFTGPRTSINKFFASKGSNSKALRNAIKGYARNAAGNTNNLAKRMRPSTVRVGSFFETINTFKDAGKKEALEYFNLRFYRDKSLYEILGSLTDIVFKDSDHSFDNTQDDSIVKLAYSKTIVRICSIDGITLENLSDNQIETMVAIFVEETIVQRIFCDIGNDVTEKVGGDVDTLLQLEENLYQIVHGLVRTQIMPEIIATQRGDKTDLETKVENIYRIAFDAIAYD
jgi:hypothetical protein